MICRRCGMDSSTTDTCEWCKKPMLPPGGSISMKAKEEILKEQEQAAAQPAEVPNGATSTRSDETELEAVVRRPETAPPPAPTIDIPGLTALGSHYGAVQEEEVSAPSLSAVEQNVNDTQLLPLGAMGASEKGDEGSDQTIYIGSEDQVLRPIERPSKDGVRYMIDASGRKKRVYDETPEVPEKIRLLNGTIQGAIISILMAFIQFIVVKDHKMPEMFVVLTVPGEGFVSALVYGAYSSILMGFMLSALLVAKKWGPVVGFLIGGVGLGVLAMLNSPNYPWSLITGAIAGIFVGKAAVKGVKRIVSV